MRALAETKSLFEICRVTGNPGYNVSGGLPQKQIPIGPGFINCPVCHDTGRIKYRKIYNQFDDIAISSEEKSFQQYSVLLYCFE